MSLMSLRLPNVGVQSSQQQALSSSLGMAQGQQQAAGTASTIPSASTAATSGPGGVTPAAADGAATGPGQAQLGAAAVQPPNAAGIVIKSALKGAVTGASVMFGVNNFWLAKQPATSGVAKVMLKLLNFVPFVPKTWPMGIVAALTVGAVTGAVFGLVGGVLKVRKATAAYNKAQQEAAAAAAAATPPAAPVAPDPAATPTLPPLTPAAPAAPKAKAKRNPVMGKGYKNMKTKGSAKPRRHGRVRGAEQTHHIKWGDTLSAISLRYGVSISQLMKLNPQIKNPNLIYAGDTLVIKP